MTKPSKDALDSVHEWLSDHGISASSLRYSSASDWVKVYLPVSKIESMLDTTYSTFEHLDGTKLMRTTRWSLPEHLHEHISTIQPTTSFFRAGPQARDLKGWGAAVQSIPAPVPAATLDAVCNTTLVTPTCLRTLYGTLDYTVKAADKNSMALNDFLGEINNRSDAALYFEMFRPDALPGATEFKQVSVDDGTLQQTQLNETQLEAGTGIEGNLDLQTMLGIAYPTPMTTYSTGGLNPVFIPDLFTTTDSDEPYIVWLNYITSLPDSALPKSVSSSYGDDEQTIPESYAKTACNMFAQLGARGVSVLFSSGDEGVGPDGYCYSNIDNSSTFLPAFPATCPYVTAVGGTQNFDPEIAVFAGEFSTPFTSGGGFSNYFPAPAYQAQYTKEYLSTYIGAEYSGLYNPSGRGYPDVAAQSLNFSIAWNGTIIPVSGTSAASPLFAGVVTLVNDALLAAGKPTLGFMNPWLYKYGKKAFVDITAGSSAGCNTSGFPAEVGWDAVTGWGTPYLPSWLEELGVPYSTASTAGPVSQISDGQPQAPTGVPVSQISDGQPQAATTGAPVSQISDGQPQATATGARA